MARLPRLCLAGLPHLVLLLAHNAQPLYADDADRRAFLALLGEAAREAGLRVHAYGLGESEVHLLATPPHPQDLSRAMQRVARGYGSAYNRRHARQGTLWNGRFRATVLDPDSLLLEATRYVEAASAPTAGGEGGHGVAGAGALNRWSSASHHLGERADPLVADSPAYWQLGNTPFEREAAYRRLTESPLTASQAARLREATLKAWALGPAPFVAGLSAHSDRPMQPRRRGRPRKVAAPT